MWHKSVLHTAMFFGNYSTLFKDLLYELLRRNGFSGQSSTENNKKNRYKASCVYLGWGTILIIRMDMDIDQGGENNSSRLQSSKVHDIFLFCF